MYLVTSNMWRLLRPTPDLKIQDVLYKAKSLLYRLSLHKPNMVHIFFFALTLPLSFCAEDWCCWSAMKDLNQDQRISVCSSVLMDALFAREFFFAVFCFGTGSENGSKMKFGFGNSRWGIKKKICLILCKKSVKEILES